MPDAARLGMTWNAGRRWYVRREACVISQTDVVLLPRKRSVRLQLLAVTRLVVPSKEGSARQRAQMRARNPWVVMNMVGALCCVRRAGPWETAIVQSLMTANMEVNVELRTVFVLPHPKPSVGNLVGANSGLSVHFDAENVSPWSKPNVFRRRAARNRVVAN
jgi:hypothetical protein